MTPVLKSETFTLNNQNIKQEVTTELAFTLEVKNQNKHFSEEYLRFFGW